MTRIVIVDDEVLIAADIEEMVSLMGHQVVGVANTRDKAVTLAETLQPDLVLMDIELNDHEDGIDAAGTIHNRFQIPIIFLTAHADQQILNRAKTVMPYGYLLKPIVERELKVTIEMALFTARVNTERREALAALKQREQELQRNQERTQLAQEAAGIGIFEWDLTNNSIYWSPHNDTIFGHEAGSLQIDLEGFLRLVHPDDRTFVSNHILDAMRRGTHFSLEHRIVRRDGAIRWIAERGRIFRDPDDRAVSLRGILTDVTVRREEDQRIRQLSVAIEQSPITVVITDPTGDILYVNPQFCHLTGYSAQEAIGRNPRILKSGRQSTAFYQTLWKTITAGKHWKGELYNRKKNGAYYWESATISPILNQKGDITHFVAIKEDITDRKTLEARLMSARDATEAANRAKSEFLANMSHELRTPLNSIIGFSQILQNEAFGPLNTTQLEYLRNIKESGDHLLDMVNDILDLSKIEAGRLTMEKKPFHFGEMIDRSLLIVQSLAIKRDLHIHVDIDPETGWLVGDEIRLKQVVFNLLSNAVKFTGTGGKIGIRTRPDGQNIELVVWDKGIGIDKAHLETIFNPFEQVREGRPANEGGTGLGLAISRQIIDLHQGRIFVASRKGQGSRFTVTLPGRLSELPPKDVTSSPQPNGKPVDFGEKLRVLIVEDNPGNMKLMKAALKPLHCIVTGVGSGEEALTATGESDFDLVFMDIQLPGIDGTETMKTIREKGRRPVPIVALTAFAMKGDRETYLQAGFDDYLSKPIDLSRMRFIVQQYSGS
jgi:two-component system, sensor histidine kinase and response regulator